MDKFSKHYTVVTYCVTILQTLTARIPITVPRIAPARTSVGKCRNRYILLNAIKAARRYAASPAFL